MGAERGYPGGLDRGMSDFARHRIFMPSRHDEYRDADHGYDSSFGSKSDYEAGYRRGFEDGYSKGFHRN